MKKIFTLLFLAALVCVKGWGQTQTVPFASSGTWTCPTGVTSVTVQCWGGGGAGGSAKANSGTVAYALGGGGAGGAYATSTISVVPGTVYTVTVGAAVAGTTSTTDNTVVNGNPSWFGSASTVYAEGGAGGVSRYITTNITANGAGGTASNAASIGTTTFKGGNGGTPPASTSSVPGGGGGSSAGTAAAGNAGTSGGGAGAAPTGGGAGGAGSNNATGATGSVPGGGGGGARSSSTTQYKGGTGAAGQVVLSYLPPYKDSWVSYNVGSANWCAGETRTVSVTVKNTGSATWTTSSPVINIGVKWNADADYLVRTSANNLAPGATQTYSFTVTAPSTTGTNNLTFDIVEEGVAWFASNAGGTGPGNVVYTTSNLTISSPITALSYSAPSPTYCTGTAITANNPTVTGGAATSYSVSPALPAGLSLNTSTGVITGTPTTATAAASYVVTASNACGSTTSTLNITVNTSVSALTYTISSATYCINSAITPNTVSSVTGGGTITYSVSPALPAGLSLNTATGTISGTPTTATASATYTVTATNGCSSTTQALTIAVTTAPTGLTYTNQSPVYCTNNAIATNTATATGGTPASYSVNPALPAGLTLNTATGAITGTPTTATALATYVVTATNTCGSITSNLNITVQTGVSNLTYTTTSASYCTGVAIATNSPTVTGGGTITYSVTPSLPAGLSLNTTTGAITGTPTTVTASATYTVTATNGCSSTSKALTIAVNATLTSLTYSAPSPTYCTNNAIATNTPTATANSGTLTYSVNPALPAGLTLNSNGTITGTPTAVTALATYNVTASNGCSSTTANLNIIVQAGVSGLTYTTSSATYCINSAITPNTVSSVTGGGTITYSVSPALPAGLSLNTSTGAISGTPTAATASAAYTVTATNGCSSTTQAVTITVNALPVFTSVTATPASICTGGSSQLAAAVTSSSPYTYTTIASPSPATGTQVAMAANSFASSGFTDEDDGFKKINLPFAFNFYGTSYSSTYVGINGFITFGGGSTAASGSAIPTSDFASGKQPVIALCYSDLYLITGEIDTFTVGTAPNRKFVIKYNGVGFYSGFGTTSGKITGQIELNETSNIIDLYINSVTNSSQAKSIGVENSTTTGTGVTNRNGGSSWTVSSVEGYRFSNVSYSWSPASGLSSTTIYNPVATLTKVTTSPVTTTYTVTATSAAGCTSASNVTVTVKPLPTATISGSPSNCAGVTDNLSITLTGTQPWTVVYNDGSSNHTISGITSSPYTLSVSPTVTTNYSLVSVNDNAGCGVGTVSGTATVTVYAAPTITGQPNTTTQNQNLCQQSQVTPLTVTATTASASLSYQWYSNPGNNSNTGGTSVGSANGGQTVTYTPQLTGTTTYYYVIVTDACGKTTTSNVSGPVSEQAVQFNTQPTPTQTVCQNTIPTTLNPSVTSTDAVFQWYSNASNNNTGGSPISGANSQAYTPPTNVAGTFYYYLYVTSSTCVATATSAVATVIVNPPTAITSDINNTPQTICQNTSATSLSVTAVGGNVTYQWYSNTTASNTGGTSVGSANGGQTTTFTPPTTAAGTTYYYVVVSGSCAPNSVTSSVSGAITVTPATAITSNVSTTPQTLCQNSTATTLSVTATGTGTLSYHWYSNATNSNSGGSAISGANSTTFTPPTNTAGTTYYYVVVSGGTCAPASVTSAVAPVTINVTPTATVAAATPSSVCAGTSVQVTFTGTPGAVVSYTINGGTVQTVTIGSGGNVSVNSSSNANTYTYTITGITLGSCSGTTGAANQSTTVTVNAYPIATISVNPGTGYVQIGNTVQLTAGTGGGTWTSNNTPVATVGNTSGTVTGVTSGTATIGYSITTNGCSSSSSQLITVTADFITKQAGNFSDFHTWNIGTPNGVSPSSSPIPTSTSTVEVEHALTLDQSFSVGAGKNLNIGTGGTMEIAPNVMFISLGTVAFNGNHVTVRSTALGTGAIGYMENPIVGASNVTVERYIPLTTTNGSAGRTGRAWRLLTSPVTGMTIKDAWQEGATGVTNNPNPGYGTIITGQGIPGSTASSTFDYIASGGHNASILQYNPGTTTGIWQVPDVNNTTGTNTAVSSQPAWFLFVRGDRTANTSTAKGTTTLRATGTLNQGDQPPINIPVKNAYTLVGNPFASPIDFEQIYQNSQIAPQFFTWNSKNGVYGSYTLTIRNGVNDYTTVPDYQISSTGTADANARYIMSSEGFFVQPATTLSDGTLVIPRASKNAGDATVGINPYRVSASTEGRLFINLNLAGSTTDTAAVLADGVMARFDKSYASAIDGDDIRKQSNFNENLGIESNSTSLMVEARPEVQKTDTLQLKLWNVTRRSYQLQLKGANFAQAAAQKGLHAYLEDSYLKTKQEISLSGSVTTIAFSVTSDALSYDSHRFRVVFESDASSILPITLTQVKAQLQNSGVSVSWSTQNEVNVRKYTVERSVNGGSTFSGIATATAKNLGATTPLSSYETFDAAPVKGDNLYRIRVEGVDGKVTYTGVVKVTVGEDASGKTLITLYPNPVSRREGKAWLNLKNVKAGDYLLSVYSESGQNIMEKKITVATGSRSQTESLSLPSSLAQGSYQLQLTNSNGIKVFTSKLIIGK